MANQFAKDKIDFDVYERADPASQVDWGQAAKDITKTFEGIRDERQKKKDAIQKSFQDQQTALNDIGEYDNPTIGQFVMNGGQDASNTLLDAKNLVERGLMKPSDVTMMQHNIKTGFDLVKKNALAFDKTFQEYTTRVQDGTGAPGETWLAKQLEGFANMNNMQLSTDKITGNMVMLRVDEEGKPIPGESMSVQQMTLLMKQKIDNFDSTVALEDINKSMGTIITAEIDPDGIRTNITTEERSRAETEFFATEGGQDFLDIKTDEFLANPPGFNQQSLMINAGLTTDKGEKYVIGSQEEYDKWNKENSDDEDNNPILRMDFGEDNLYRPEFNDAQTEAARAHASQMITGSLDVKETQTVKKTQATEYKDSAAEIAKGEKDDAKSSLMGDYITLLTDEDPAKRHAIEKSLRTTRNSEIEKHNSKVSNDEDKLPLIDKVTKGTPPRSATQKDVDNGLADNVGDEVIENREIILSDGTKHKLEGTITEQIRVLEALYDPDNQLTTDDIEKLAKDRGFDLDTDITGGKGKKKERTQADIDKWLTDNPGKTVNDVPFQIGDKYFDYSEKDIKTSKAAYAKPNYTKDLQIKGKSDLMTAKDYLDAEYGYGSGAEFNSSVDTTKGIGEGMINLINASLDPAMLEQFNTTPGMELSMTFETGAGQDSVTFNFGGKSLTIGGKNGDLNKGDLYGGNGYELWQALQDNLLNPAINKLNKERTGGGADDYEL